MTLFQYLKRQHPPRLTHGIDKLIKNFNVMSNTTRRNQGFCPSGFPATVFSVVITMPGRFHPNSRHAFASAGVLPNGSLRVNSTATGSLGSPARKADTARTDAGR